MTATQPTAGTTAGAAGAAPAAAGGGNAMVWIGICITLLLSGLDNTIVATAMPTVVGQLGGFARYTWVTTAYVVTSTVATMLLGKLGDLYGRRRVFLFTISTFLVGSLLCGAAQNMTQLIVFRALQGFGGGGIFALAFAIVGDIVAPRDRGRYFGMFTGIFALSSVAGPLIGGLIVDHTTWRWIFYVNVPLGVLTLFIIATGLKLPVREARGRLDVPGAALLVAFVGCLMIALEQGPGTGWSSPKVTGLLVGAAVLGVAFVLWSRHAAEGILPMRLFGSGVFSISMLLVFMLGTAMMGTGLFFSLFFQDVRFVSPTRAGLMTVPVMFGMMIGSSTSGRLISRLGRYREMPLVGIPVAAVGFFLASTVHASSGYLHIAAGMFLSGLGLGSSMPALSVSAQNAAPASDLGVATSSNNFFRSLGSSIGLAVYGGVMNATIRSELEKRVPDRDGSSLMGLIREPHRIKALEAPLRSAVTDSIASGVTRIFLLCAVVTVASFFVALLFKNEPLRTTTGHEAPAMMEA